MVKQGSQRRAHAELALLYTLKDGVAACNIMNTTYVQRLMLGGDSMIKTGTRQCARLLHQYCVKSRLRDYHAQAMQHL